MLSLVGRPLALGSATLGGNLGIGAPLLAIDPEPVAPPLAAPIPGVPRFGH